MFGCVVAGKPLITDVTTVSDTQCLFTLPYPPGEVKHLVMFLTSPLPNPGGVELGAAIYLGYSALGSAETHWMYLGRHQIVAKINFENFCLEQIIWSILVGSILK